MNNSHIDRFGKGSNNEKVFSSLDRNIKRIDNKNIMQKINDIFNSKNYIYKADVVIYTSKDTLRERIIGRNNNFLITNNNELIPISDIEDIEYQ